MSDVSHLMLPLCLSGFVTFCALAIASHGSVWLTGIYDSEMVKLFDLQSLAVHYRRDRNDAIGELMKRTFCRPYGTDPRVHIIRPSSRDTACRVSTVISHPYGIKRE